jgi:ribosomal protein S18 acetylase RimI-like enzyme
MTIAPLETAPIAGGVGRVAFRPLGPADSAIAAELIRVAFATQAERTDPPSSALRESALSVADKFAAGGGGVAALIGGAIVGLALWREKDGALHIGRLSVLAAWRGRGIGRALIDRGEREARRRGLTRLSLNVRLALDDNQRLFAACGFRRVGVASHPGYAEPTLAIMEKPID